MNSLSQGVVLNHKATIRWAVLLAALLLMIGLATQECLGDDTPQKETATKDKEIALAGVTLENAQEQLQVTRQQMDELQSALVLLDEESLAREKRLKELEAAETDGDAEDFASVITDLLRDLPNIVTNKPADVTKDMRRNFVEAAAYLRRMWSSSRYFNASEDLSVESKSDDLPEMRRAKLLLKTNYNRQPAPAADKIAAPSPASQELKHAIDVFDRYYLEDDVDRIQAAAKILSALEPNAKTALTQWQAEMYKYRRLTTIALLKRVTARIALTRTALNEQLQAATNRRSAIIELMQKGQQKSQEILTANLLYLLIGMMSVVVIMIIVIALISRRPLAFTIVEHRTLVELAGVTFLLSAVLLLASGSRIEPATTGTLLGTIAGYILSRRSNTTSTPTTPQQPPPTTPQQPPPTTPQQPPPTTPQQPPPTTPQQPPPTTPQQPPPTTPEQPSHTKAAS